MPVIGLSHSLETASADEISQATDFTSTSSQIPAESQTKFPVGMEIPYRQTDILVDDEANIPSISRNLVATDARSSRPFSRRKTAALPPPKQDRSDRTFSTTLSGLKSFSKP